jgi:hypothetical protein
VKGARKFRLVVKQLLVVLSQKSNIVQLFIPTSSKLENPAKPLIKIYFQSIGDRWNRLGIILAQTSHVYPRQGMNQRLQALPEPLNSCEHSSNPISGLVSLLEILEQVDSKPEIPVESVSVMRDRLKLARNSIMDVEDGSFLPLSNNNQHFLREFLERFGEDNFQVSST